jgi:tetratricopeptide (TPR) repeat protein
MRRRHRKLWLVLEVTLLLVAMSMVRGSVSSADAPARRAADTEEENEVLQLLEENQLVTARRKVEALLKDDPDSMVGHYVLGRVMNESEGNLPAAMYHLGRSRQIYEQTWDVHPRPKNAPWQFHRELLYQIQATAQRMEEFDYQLEIISYHNVLYAPDLDAERAWPLMRLGRVKEARKAAKLAMRSSDIYQRKLGLNVRCAVMGELQERKRYYEACLEAFEEAKKADVKGVDEKHQSTVAVHAFNAAVAARAALEPEEAEKLAIEGTKRLAFTPANPWRLLVRLYADQGRMKDAVEALREMQAWRRKQPPSIRSQARAETDVVFSTVLLLAAQPKTGLRLLDMALDRPDRRGLTSSTPEQALGAHALLRRALANTAAELAAERASYDPSVTLTDSAWSGAKRRFSMFADEERVVSVLSDTERLVATLRVFVRGGIEPVPVWLVGDLVEVLGPGIVAVALDEARYEEDEDDVKPYFDAIEAEVALAQGDEDRAIDLAERALKKLPKTEALLKARTAAVGAMAAEADGDDELYLAFLAQAMELDPSVIRRRGMSLPVAIESSSAKTAKLVREKLMDSPRLREGEGAFLVKIAGKSRDLEVCLFTPEGAKLSCAKAPAPDDGKTKESADGYAARVVEAFHTQALAMPLGLSAADLASLDSSTTVAEQAAREKLDQLLEEAVKKEEE